jgi:trk system potassium uptake protein TrkH
MRVALVFGVIGYLMRWFALTFIAPLLFAIYEWIRGDAAWWSPLSFAFALAFTAVVATLFSRMRRNTSPLLRRSEALAVVAGAWLCVALCGGIPYIFAGVGPVDSFFESLSGFTTTGATILTDFSAYDRAFYLWRAMTQWFGGLGVIALFVVVLPRLGIAGRQLFFAEASAAAGDAVSPQVRDSARRLWILYTALTVGQALLLWVFSSFSLYEGLVHALTTMSAGGFSPNPQSIAGYQDVRAEWIIIVFMVLSGASFTLQYRAFTGRPLAFFRDREFMTYLILMTLLTLGVGMLLVGGLPTATSVRDGAFQVASLMSSTGYASVEYASPTPGVSWKDEILALLLLAMVIGGCAGSACGGPKVVRYILTGRWLKREVTQVLHPRAVIPLRYGRMAIPMQVMRAVTTLVFLYVIGYAMVGAAVVIMEPDVDLVTGFSASLACVGNIGPAFGTAGPMENYAFFSAPAKLLLALGMWIGRLEIVTVIALLHPHVWRHLQWRGNTGGGAGSEAASV